MRRWGLIITVFYVLLLLAALGPAIWMLGGASISLAMFADGYLWVWVALLTAGQALLLFLSVDTRWQRRSPRRHVRASVAAAALLFALLFLFGVISLAAGIAGDDGIDRAGGVLSASIGIDSPWTFLLIVLAYWVIWTVLLTLYVRDASERLTRLLSWLIKGSVLELLIAVPSHIVARQRTDCCAAGASAAGIATGIAVMLAAFGPGVLLLYKQRLERLTPRDKSSRRPR